MSLLTWWLLCEQFLKRDVVSTVATRVLMMLEELQASEGDSKGSRKGGEGRNDDSALRNHFRDKHLETPETNSETTFCQLHSS